jgi:hypothetical protein
MGGQHEGPRVTEEIDEAILEAIMEGARAGVFRAAARLNPKTAKTWHSFGDTHSEKVAALLDVMVKRSAG